MTNLEKDSGYNDIVMAILDVLDLADGLAVPTMDLAWQIFGSKWPDHIHIYLRTLNQLAASGRIVHPKDPEWADCWILPPKTL